MSNQHPGDADPAQEAKSPISILNEKIERLTQEVGQLCARVERLEKVSADEGSRPELQAATPPAPPPPPIIPPGPDLPPSSPIQGPPPIPASARIPPQADLRPPLPPPPAGGTFNIDWETVIAGRGAFYIGALLVFLVLAWVIGYAWQHLGIGQRLLLGGLAGAGFIAAGWRAHGRLDRWFSEGLSGTGLAILYLTVWAATQVYGQIGFQAAFTMMVLITAAGVGLALRFDALSLVVLSTLGGFLTPGVLSTGTGATGGGQAVPLLTYIAVLNAGILTVSLFRRWRSLVLLSFVATIVLVLAWSDRSFAPALDLTVFAFITIYFLEFAAAASLSAILRNNPAADEDVLLLFADSVAYGVAGQWLLQDHLGSFPAAFPFSLALFFALLAVVALRAAPGNRPLIKGAIALAILSVTLAAPIQLKQPALSSAWMLEAAVLVTLATLQKSIFLLRWGQVIWIIGALAVAAAILADDPGRGPLFLNPRALPLLVGAISSAWLAFWTHLRKTEPADTLSDLYGAAAVLGGALLITMENWLGFSRASGAATNWQPTAVFVLSSLLWVYALAAYAAGSVTRFPIIRFCSIATAAVATVLPFLGSASVGEAWRPFWNFRLLAFAVASAGMGILRWMLAQEPDQAPVEEEGLLGVLPVALASALIIGISIEIYGSCSWWGIPGKQDSVLGACFLLSAFWAVCGSALISLGLSWHQPGLRGLGYTVAVSGVAALLIGALASVGAPWRPFGNLRLAAFAVTSASLGLVAGRLWTRSGGEEQRAEGSTQIVGITAIVAALWGVSQEIALAFGYYRLFGVHFEVAAADTLVAFWSAAFAVILHFGITRKNVYLRWLSYGLALVALVTVLPANADPAALHWTPLWNLRFLAYVSIVAALVWGAYRLLRRKDAPAEEHEYAAMATGYAAMAMLLAGATVETYGAFEYYRPFGNDWGRWAQAAISVVWTLCAVGILVGGIVWNYASVRMAALGILAVTVLKVFMVDLAFLDTPARILSFSALGVVLLGISWRYTRFAGSSGNR